MSRIFNFSAGPCTLPLPVIEEAAAEFVDYKDNGMSIIEMSHRSKPYDEVHHEAMTLISELLEIPDNYKVMFLGGGATMQFAMIPMNFLPAGKSCDFTVTGTWGKKAYADAAKVGDTRVIFDGKDVNYLDLPDPSTLEVDPNAAYLHMTSNETIGGIQWQKFPDCDAPIICDISSDFMSRKMPIDKFGMLYAGAQKNAGPAGVAIAIVRDDLLERCPDTLPAYLNYNTHAPKDSMYNTPPVFPIYMVGKTMKWLKSIGGVDAATDLANQRAGLIYGAMTKDSGFYNCPVPEAARSNMNIVFRLPTEDLEKQFIAEALEADMSGLKGHRSVGGCRASVYNSMPVAGAQALADFMGDFAAKNG